MSAIIKIPKDEQKYEEAKKTIEKLKNYGIQGKDVLINNDPYHVIPLRELGDEERITLEHELYVLKRNHGIITGILDPKTDVVKKLVEEGKL